MVLGENENLVTHITSPEEKHPRYVGCHILYLLITICQVAVQAESRLFGSIYVVGKSLLVETRSVGQRQSDLEYECGRQSRRTDIMAGSSAGLGEYDQ